MSGGWSLRRRLVALFILAAVVTWLLGAVWLARQARHEAEVMFDASLMETAHVVLALAAHELGEGHDEGAGLDLEQVDHAHVERLFYQVRSPGGDIAMYSPGAPAAPLADAAERGFSRHVVDAADWRVYSLNDPRSGLTIHVGEPAARRDDLARAALLRLAGPGLLLVLLLAGAAWYLSGLVVRPVVHAARRVDALAPGEDVSLPAGELPREIAPLAHAIERLQKRVHQVLLVERTLTADAAHELRTPLAALRAQAQWAQRAADGAERSRALEATVAAADRCARLADAVLTLARLDATTPGTRAAPAVPVQEIVRLIASDVAPAAAARGVAVEASCAPVALAADPDALAVLLRNLLDNAVRHARRRVTVDVSAGDEILIAVRDDGEGVSEDARARLFDRFYRVPGSDTPGSGIGLALVKRVAELHGGSVALGEGVGGRGLGIEVRLPRSLAR
jgi:signal transduction histidine kinase